MGGLFSSNESSQKSSHRPSFAVYQESETIRQQQEERRMRQLQEERRMRQLQEERRLHQIRLQEEQSLQRQRQMQYVLRNRRKAYHVVLRSDAAGDWSPMPADKSFIKVQVQEYTDEYIIIMNHFKKSTQKRFEVKKIERIQNPYLLGCFMLKCLEMQSMFRHVKEELLFHGTKERNVDSICENNFNWRLHGESTGNRFGKGVSFSPISYYASHYSDKRNTIKVMFLVRVLVSNVTEGSPNMILPPFIGRQILRFDTTEKDNGHVKVKFCDNEFYPAYLIHYTVGPQIQKKVHNNYSYRSNYVHTDFDDDIY